MTRVAAVTDDLCHLEHWGGSHSFGSRLTECGKPVAANGTPTGPACHVCLPAEAHPLAAVWAQARRHDERFNADLGRTG